MDENLSLITQWFTSLGITANLDKLKRQLSMITSWFSHKGIGVCEAVTGFGKTYIAIIAIYRLNLKYPGEKTIVVVPSLKLYKDWIDHVIDFNLKDVQVYVVNTYTKEYVKTYVKYNCTLLVCDEIHRVLSLRGTLFNKTITCTNYRLLLGLTATLEQEERDILATLNIPIADTVTMSEARRFGYISEYIVYNYGLTLNTNLREVYDRFNDIHNSNFAKFRYFVDGNKNWEFIRACTAGNQVKARVGEDVKTGQEWREWYAEKMNWDSSDNEHDWSPKNISKYAHQWNWAMTERKNFLYNIPAKIEAVKEITNKFDVPTITFAETIQFVDSLVKELGSKARAYHSNIPPLIIYEPAKAYRNFKYAKAFRQRVNGKIEFDEAEGKYAIHYNKEIKLAGSKLKQKIINDFEDNKFSVLCTAKALDEGFNVEGIELGIICSASSKQRNSIQRTGRTLRFVPNKTARIINLYIKDTQDEYWLKKRQKGDTNIRWVESIDEII
jgi:superfamily II DNA or RNA helicase